MECRTHYLAVVKLGPFPEGLNNLNAQRKRWFLVGFCTYQVAFTCKKARQV